MFETMSKSSGLIVGIGVAVTAFMIAPPEITALESSGEVDTASIMVEPNHTIDDRTLYAGIEQCEALVGEEEADEESVSFEYETNQNLQDGALYDGVFHYPRERGGSSLNCVQDGELQDGCQRIDDDLEEYSLEVSDDGFEVSGSVGFRTLSGLESIEDCQEYEGELDEEYRIQLRLRRATDADWERSEVRVILDLIRPDAPELSDALATEHTIRVEFEGSESDDTNQHRVVYSSEAFEAGDLAEDIMDNPMAVEGTESGRVDVELSPGSTVYVALVAEDDAGNFSVVSEPMETTVLETEGFWDVYVDGGGDEQGGYGCQSATAGASTVLSMAALMVLALVGRLLMARREATKCRVQSSQREGRRR